MIKNKISDNSKLNPITRILVVQDNLANQLVTMTILKKKGFYVACANNGLEAITLLETDDFDIVLMDVSMPVMDGLTATKKIRLSSRAKVPIIAMTAHNQMEDRDRCLESGMDDFLSKPASGEDMITKINSWLC